MKCLYCGKRILAFRLFSGGETFCSEEHGNLFRKNEAENAIQRILTLDPPKKARLTPAPVVAIMPPPTVAEPDPPPMAGFRLPVLEGRDHSGETTVGPLPISLEILTPAYATSAASVAAATPYHQLAWPSGTAASDRAAMLIPTPHYERVPSTPAPAFALSGTGPLQPLPWVPRADSFGQGEASGLLTTERMCATVSFAAPRGFAPAFASAQLGWSALADGSANAPARGSLAPEVVIATPCLTLERFTSTWAAHGVRPLWTRGCNDSTSVRPTYAEVSSSLAASLRLPSPRAERDARPSATGPASLWRIASEGRSQTAEITATPHYQLPELAGSFLRLASGRLDALSLVSCRPFPWLPRVAPETVLAPSLWSAWPELPTACLEPAQRAAALANGHSWKPVNGAPSLIAGRSNSSGLRLLDAPERCRTVALTLPVENSALRQTAPTPDARGIAAALPTPLVHPLALPISPRETVLSPAHVSPAIHQPLATAPTRGVAPAAQLPPMEARPVAQLGREAIALRMVSPWPDAGTWVSRPLLAVPLLPAFRFRASAPVAENSGAPLLAEPGCHLQQPALGSARVAGLRNSAGVPQGWGETADSRPLEPALAQQRETALRLSVEEIPCRCTLDVAPPAALPTTSASWTALELSSALPERDLPTAELASPGHNLRAPGVRTTYRAVSVVSASFGALAWTGLNAAPEPVVRRRQLPASRPKMNLPRPRALAGSIALPGLPHLAAILAAESQAASNAALELAKP